MKVILKILKNYLYFSTITGIIVAILIFALIYMYDAIQLDFKLLQEIQLLQQYQDNLLNIPSNWEVVANSECEKDISFGFSYSQDCFLCRQVYFYTTINDIDFCITQKAAISLSFVNKMIIIASLFVIIAFAILFYYVLVAYLYSGVWKRIAMIQNACNLSQFTKKSINACSSLVEIIEVSKKSPKLYAKIQNEFSEIFDSIRQNAEEHIAQKKIPEQYAREFEIFSKKL